MNFAIASYCIQRDIELLRNSRKRVASDEIMRPLRRAFARVYVRSTIGILLT